MALACLNLFCSILKHLEQTIAYIKFKFYFKIKYITITGAARTQNPACSCAFDLIADTALMLFLHGNL